MKLNIGYLYPKQMNIYGDRGNIIALQKRAQWRDIDVKVNEYDLGDKIKPGVNDLYFFGGGQDQEQVLAAKDLVSKAAVLEKDFASRSVFLAICGGYQLLGHYYQDQNGDRLEGIGLVDLYTQAGEHRMIGNTVITLQDLDLTPKTLVGFENHSGETFLGPGVKPLGQVVKGFGNNGQDGFEGARFQTFFGSYLHGSLLPKNPHFADFLIELALKRKEPDFKLVPLDDSLELAAHQAAVDLINK